MVSTSRVVAVLTPVISGGAAALAGWLAKKGISGVGTAELSSLIGVVFAGGIGLGHKYLDGQSKWERSVEEAARWAESEAKGAFQLVDKDAPTLTTDLEALIKAEVAKLVPAPVVAVVTDAEEAAAQPAPSPLDAPVQSAVTPDPVAA